MIFGLLGHFCAGKYSRTPAETSLELHNNYILYFRALIQSLCAALKCAYGMKNGRDMPNNHWHAAVFDFRFLQRKDRGVLLAGP